MSLPKLPKKLPPMPKFEATDSNVQSSSNPPEANIKEAEESL